MRSGRFAVASEGGWLYFGDENLNPLEDQFRNYQPNLGLRSLSGLAWDSDAGAYLVSNLEPGSPSWRRVVEIPDSLDSVNTVGNLSSASFYRSFVLTYLPDEHRLAAGRSQTGSSPPPAIGLFQKNSTPWYQLWQTLNLSSLSLGNPMGLEYVPAAGQFAVSFASQPAKLYLLSRAGAIQGSIDFSAAGLSGIQAIAYFERDGAGRFLVVGRADTKRVLISDLAGNVLSQFSYLDQLDIFSATDVAAITTGPRAGAFAILDPAGNDMVVFRLK